MNKYICDKCGGVSYSSSSQAPCQYCKEDVKAGCSECVWKSPDACRMCDLKFSSIQDEQIRRTTFREGQLVVYKNGKIKRVVEDGAFVYYHEGETAAKTPFDCMFPIEHCIKQTSLGGIS